MAGLEMDKLRLSSRTHHRRQPARRMTAASYRDERGVMMAALLVSMAVMAIAMTAMLPAWRTMAQREKEAELVFRGEQYARAINLFQRKNGNASPPTIDLLVEQRYLRKKYKDPITGGDFQVVMAGTNQPGPGPSTSGRGAQDTAANLKQLQQQLQQQADAARGGGTGRGGIVGVMSTSPLKSFRVYNGRDTYNQWVFMGVQQSTRAGGPGGAPGRVGADGRAGADGGGRTGRGG